MISTRFTAEVLALFSGTLFSTALALQSRGLATVTVERASPGVRRAWWLAGSALAGLAYVVEFLSLRHAPLSIAAPLIAAGTVTLPLADRLVNGRTIRVRSLLAISFIVVGCVLLNVHPTGAASRPATVSHGSWALVGAFAVAAAIASAILWFRWSGAILVSVTGVAFACSGVTSRLLATSSRHVELVAAAVCTVVLGGLGMWSELLSLRRLSATVVGPSVLALTTIGGALIAPLAIGDEALTGTSAWLGVALILLGATALCAGASHEQGTLGEPVTQAEPHRSA